ncbi:DNA-binding protein [Acerihabitans sp. TG2]|uniref:DNA-binding protein n=1 Tax=Acerihabitans sp. TG2 TaxID=3096008 RepID=UPI002B23DCCB|nr:DNA-binding protein [Acerihabitans sp. TG2]MEA9392947.1 DNA-binding protein [Acerihabitans sp. TG2]
MKKDWYRTSELKGVGGLPTTRQGITARARREKWVSKPVSGVQGKGLEFALESLPPDVQRELVRRAMQESPALPYLVNLVSSEPENDRLAAWMTIYQQLKPQERDDVISLVLRDGIAAFIVRLGIVPRA